MPDAAPALSDVRAVTVRQVVAALSASFHKVGVPTPELDARLLVLEACHLSPEAYVLRPETPVRVAEAKLIRALEARRLAREPVSRILGFREFWGRRFAIGPAVLDPRPDTETLIEAALSLLGETNSAEPLRILDLGTGSGCVLLTLLAEMPQVWGVGADISSEALHLARMNGEQLGVVARAAFVQCDWCETFAGPFGLIIANPPYIQAATISALDDEVRCYDPKLALDGGASGLMAYRCIIRHCMRIAAADAWVIMEVGMGQASGVTELFVEAGWIIEPEVHRVFQDLSGIDRVVAIKRQEARR